MSDVGGLHYIHERIDQLVRQTALEVGLIRLHTGVDATQNCADEDAAIQATQDRFWAAQDAAADNHGHSHRGP